MKRRSLLKTSFLAAGAALPLRAAPARFRISLAQWSIHKAIQSRMITNLDFPRIAREQFGIEGLEFVNGLWEAPTQDYLRRLKASMQKTGTTGVLLMVDGEGMMGHSDRATRMKAADNHHKWVDIAAELGCHSIRTNMYPDRQPATPAEISEFVKRCSESFAALCGYAQPRKISVIIENHGGISSNPDVVVQLMKAVSLPNFGTLPDFGNFPKELDRYEAVGKLMPYAKGVSFKCYDFSPDGRETTLDLGRMMKVVADTGYREWVGIEYEGSRLTEFEGIQAAKRALERLL
ncbi:MAG: sugar phosphate isomerase/epimerase [Acidobacteria bacterium]|nr:sugar phosphate isomerase/epimerase [Acidobacteriota bacterium]